MEVRMTCWCLLFRSIEVGKLLAKACDFRQVVHHDVGLVRMVNGVVLMVSFGFIEGFESDNLRRNAAIKDLCLVELVNISFGNVLLFFAGVKDSRAVLRADVRSLPIQLRGVMRNREE